MPVAATLACLIIVGSVYERIGQRRDRARYPQIGRSVDIGGRTLNIYCSGEGRPAVVFDTFGHQAGYSWVEMQPVVAKFTQACWYDRAGYGWSDPSPAPHTFQSSAADLHALLHNAGVAPPYALVAGGDAALRARVFHGLYAREVAGVVMLNPNDVDGPESSIPDSAQGAWAKHFGSMAPQFRGAACAIYPLLAGAGLVRLFDEFQGFRRTPAYGLTERQQAELDFLSDNATAQRGSELCARGESMDEVRAAGGFGDLPLIVVASRERYRAPDAAAFSARWIGETQPALARLSTRGRLVVVDGEITQETIVQAVRGVAGK
jgi:hypothetical protein